MLQFFHAATMWNGGSLIDKLHAWYEGSLLRELVIYIKETYFTLEFGVYDHISIDPASANTSVLRIVLGIMLGLIVASAMITYTRTNTSKFIKSIKNAGADSPENAKTLAELGAFRSAFVRRELKNGALRRAILCREEEEMLAAWRESLLQKLEQEEFQNNEPEGERDEGEGAPENPNSLESVDACEAKEATEGNGEGAEEEKADAQSEGLNGELKEVDPRPEEIDARPEEEEEPFDPLAARRKQLAEDSKLAAHFGVERPTYKPDYTEAHFYMPDDLRYHAEFRFTRRGATWGRFVLSAVVILVIGGLVIRLLPAVMGLLDGLVSMMAPSA